MFSWRFPIVASDGPTLTHKTARNHLGKDIKLDCIKVTGGGRIAGIAQRVVCDLPRVAERSVKVVGNVVGLAGAGFHVICSVSICVYVVEECAGRGRLTGRNVWVGRVMR